MSKEYPCIHYYDDGKCKYFSDDKVTSYCVKGPCGAQVLSNGDRIRTMTDEELAEFIEEHCIESFCDIVCGGQCRAIRTFEKTSAEVCNDIIRNWLQQPAEEVHDGNCGDGERRDNNAAD